MFLLMVIAGFIHIVSGGDDDSRIIGGKSSEIKEMPYLASLQNSGIHFCGGSIIAPSMILTAAHCVEGVKDVRMNKLTVRVGSTMWSVGGQVKNIIGMKIHPNYNPKTKESDIALIQLGSPITIGWGDDAPKIISLADGVPMDGKIGKIGGWGKTDEKGYMIPNVLKVAEVTSITRKSCSQPPWEYGDAILPTMICAKAEGKDACQGDSGGPYASKSSGKLWGVVSWGRGCGREENPGVYAAVAKFKKWIEKNLNGF